MAATKNRVRVNLSPLHPDIYGNIFAVLLSLLHFNTFKRRHVSGKQTHESLQLRLASYLAAATYSSVSSESDQRGSWSPLEGSAVLSSYLTRTHAHNAILSTLTHQQNFRVAISLFRLFEGCLLHLGVQSWARWRWPGRSDSLSSGRATPSTVFCLFSRLDTISRRRLSPLWISSTCRQSRRPALIIVFKWQSVLLNSDPKWKCLWPLAVSNH